MERDIEKDLIEIECARKDHAKRDNSFTECVLERCYKLVSELKEYRDLEKQGKLLRLPCKVGDTVYLVYSPNKLILPFTYMPIKICGISQLVKILESKEFGKTVFLTQEQAEEALKEMEG